LVLHSECPICINPQARIGFRLASDGATMILLCDECAHVWLRPDEVDAAHALDPLRPELGRRLPGVSLEGSRWATPDEVLGYGWGAYIAALGAAPRPEGPGVHEVTPDE
jgi:hypothetical protein